MRFYPKLFSAGRVLPLRGLPRSVSCPVPSGAEGHSPMPASLHPRHNAIAELDAQIAHPETIRPRYAQDLKAPPGARRTQVLLRQAEERLRLLRRSREELLSRKSRAEEAPGPRSHPRRR